ncbi:hypothetical protein LZ30DRAFT_74060 [Colletotrichum cereale]|nr:hypothetical protein LZ30DRAFT_74060 [Colletotrichum cereale]
MKGRQNWPAGVRGGRRMFPALVAELGHVSRVVEKERVGAKRSRGKADREQDIIQRQARADIQCLPQGSDTREPRKRFPGCRTKTECYVWTYDPVCFMQNSSPCVALLPRICESTASLNNRAAFFSCVLHRGCPPLMQIGIRSPPLRRKEAKLSSSLV